ncbi:hypothetical protein JW921_07505, partial [Candidatus Fermentibacterales bacterium]|nr:hypothetical protein [Candidatus Fermentibacterales bacterium]
RRALRYQGKGCLTAVENVQEYISRAFEGRDPSRMTLREIDGTLLALERTLAVRRGKLPADADHDRCVAVMQRKQNLGMNAVLSVSLSLARAVASVSGMELYELLREEMLGLMDRLAADCGIEIAGSGLPDYVGALRLCAAVLDERGTPLYQALRRISGIYDPESPSRG